MRLRICNHIFDSDEIRSITIRDDQIFIDGTEDFYKLSFRDEYEIRDAINWIKLQKMTYRDLQDAIETLIYVCEFYINEKSQCNNCPMHNKRGCMLQAIPIDWKN